MRHNHSRFLFILCLVIALAFPGFALAGPTSTHYELKQYGFGAGGTAESSSTHYKMNGTAGEIEAGQAASSKFSAEGGLIFTEQANVPGKPTLTVGSNYNKIGITLDAANNPSNAEFAIAVSPDGFSSTTQYVQADETLGSTPVWQTNTLWGASGFYIIGLVPGTTYSVKVAARNGNYTQTGFGPIQTATTANPTLSFSLKTSSQNTPPFTVALGNLNPNSVTTSNDTVSITTTTNGTSGATIYVNGQNSGLRSTTSSHTINSVSTDLTGLNEGYGAQGVTVSQTSGGPMEIVSPYDGSGNTVGVVDTEKRVMFDSSGQPVDSGQASFELKAKISDTTPAGSDYTDTLTIITAAGF